MEITILHFHVTAAILTYLLFILCVVINVMVCMGRRIRRDYSVIFCDAGILFALETMGTGAVRAREAWGQAWVWEPRLTGMFLMTLFFVSWRLAIGILGKEAVSNRRLTSSLIVLGLPAMAFTHLAAKLLGGIHPQDMSHLSSTERSAWLFIVVGVIQAILGLIFVVYRIWRQKKIGECIEPSRTAK